jgi:hypothetical protein
MADRVIYVSDGRITAIERNAARRPPRELH